MKVKLPRAMKIVKGPKDKRPRAPTRSSVVKTTSKEKRIASRSAKTATPKEPRTSVDLLPSEYSLDSSDHALGLVFKTCVPLLFDGIDQLWGGAGETRKRLRLAKLVLAKLA